MGYMPKILLVDDDPEIACLVNLYLRVYDIHVAPNLQSAREKLATDNFFLILLDLGLPDGNGLQLCHEIYQKNKKSTCSVIILTTKGAKTEIVEGLDAGADDYIAKPFYGPELRARVEACFRRQPLVAKSPLVKIDCFEFDLEFQKCKVTEGQSQNDLRLTPTEFRIFLNLARSGNQLLSRNEISQKLWKESGVHVNHRAIDCHIAHLRKKMGVYSHYISAVYGKGYSFSNATS